MPCQAQPFSVAQQRGRCCSVAAGQFPWPVTERSTTGRSHAKQLCASWKQQVAVAGASWPGKSCWTSVGRVPLALTRQQGLGVGRPLSCVSSGPGREGSERGGELPRAQGSCAQAASAPAGLCWSPRIGLRPCSVSTSLFLSGCQSPVPRRRVPAGLQTAAGAGLSPGPLPCESCPSLACVLLAAIPCSL